MTQLPRRVARVVRTAPISLVLLVTVWGVAIASGVLRHPLPPDVTRRWGSGGAALALHQWWTPFTSALWARDLSGYLVVTALLVVCGFAEARSGWRRTLTLLLSSQVLGCAIAAIVVFSLRSYQFWPGDLFHSRAVGLGPGLFGVAAGVTATMRVFWRRRTRVALFAYLLVLVLYTGHLSDLQHLVGALTGLVAGRIVAHRKSPLSLPSPSRRETRILVTAVLLATTLAPVIASLRVWPALPTTSDATRLLVTSVPAPRAVRTVCSQPSSAELCQALRANLHSPGPAALLLAMLPVLLMLVFADGLRRGRRAAWWGALISHAALTAVIVVDLLGAAQPRQLVQPAVILLIPAVSIGVMLVATRGAFALRARPGTYRRALSVIGGLFVLAVVTHCAALTLLSDGFVPAATTGGAIVDFFARIAPTPLVARPALAPASPVAATVAAMTAPAFWLVLFVILLRTFWTKDHGSAEPDDHRYARMLLTRHGGGTLSYLTMWPGQRYWFNQARSVYVAHRVISGVALTTGAPIGDPAAVPGAIAEFAAHCDQHGWIPCFYAVNGELAERYQALDWHRLHVGDDALIDLTTLRFSGRRWQDVRTALHRAAKNGVRAQWCQLAQAPPAVLDQIRLMSEEWLASKGLPEMGFTLGGVEEALDDNVRCLLAIDAEERVHAVTSWLPSYRDDRVVGWTLDLMRRRATSLPGVMEFLIASAALDFQRQGLAVMSLSGTPFAFTTESEPGGAAHRLLTGAGRILEPVYGFRSLLAFKSKFQPTYQPMYLTYPEASALPAIGNAIGRAYLPAVTWRHALRIVTATMDRSRHVPGQPAAASPHGSVTADHPARIAAALELPQRVRPVGVVGVLEPAANQDVEQAAIHAVVAQRALQIGERGPDGAGGAGATGAPST